MITVGQAENKYTSHLFLKIKAHFIFTPLHFLFYFYQVCIQKLEANEV
jgi:hypothetical protein